MATSDPRGTTNLVFDAGVVEAATTAAGATATPEDKDEAEDEVAAVRSDVVEEVTAELTLGRFASGLVVADAAPSVASVTDSATSAPAAAAAVVAAAAVAVAAAVIPPMGVSVSGNL
jgi:hypothetical protein